MAKKKGRKRQQKKLQQIVPGDPVAATEGAGPPDDGGDEDDEDEGEDEPEPAAQPGETAAPATGTAGAVAPAVTAGPTPPSPAPDASADLAARMPDPGPAPTPPGVAGAPWPARLADFLTEQFEFSSLYAWVLISVVVFAAYANSLWVPFLFDDAPVITRNRNFRKLGWDNLVEVAKTPPITRSITNLTFYANYQIAGTPAYQIADPNSPYRGTYGPTWTYHVFNMALHSFNGILLFTLLQMLLSGALTGTGAGGMRGTAARRAALHKTGPPALNPIWPTLLSLLVPGLGHLVIGRTARALTFVAIQAAILIAWLLIPQEDWSAAATSSFTNLTIAAFVVTRLAEVLSTYVCGLSPIPDEKPLPPEPVAPIATWVALGATLLWLVHPVQTMAVTYISQRYAMCGAAAFLGTLVCYVALRRRMQEGTAWLESHSLGSFALLAGTLGCYMLCFVTKENSTIAPFVIVALELTFFARPPQARAESLPPTLVRWIIPGLLVAGFLYLAAAGLAHFGMQFLLPEHCPTFPNRMSYFQTEWVVLLKYLRLYALPDQLSMEQAFPGLAWSQAEASSLHLQAEPWEMFKALVGHLLILGLAVKWWLSGRRFLTFAVVWFYITLGPESTVVPILDPMVEHRLYLPSCALAAGIAYVFGRLALDLYELGPTWTRSAAASFEGGLKGSGIAVTVQESLEGLREWLYERRQAAGAWTLAALAVLVGLLGFGTFLRNRVYTPTGIWQDAIAKRPDCARAYSSLGMEFLYQEDWFSAVEPIEAALYLGPYHVEGWNNIGKAYLEIGSAMPNGPKNVALSPPLQWAADALWRGIEVNDVAPSPSVPLCWNNLGLTYLKMAERLGKDPESEKKKAELEVKAADALYHACEIDQGYETAWINLGTCLVKQADRATGAERKALARKAITAFHSSHATNPGHQLFPLCGRNLAQAYRLCGQHAMAYKVFDILGGRDDGWGEVVVALLAEEGAAASEEAVDIDARMDHLRALVGDKTAQDDLADLVLEKKFLDQQVGEFEKAAVRAEKDADGCVKTEPTFAAKLYRSAGRYFLLHDAARGRKDMNLALEHASEAEKAAWEKEARESGARFQQQGPQGPVGPVGPVGPR